LTGLWICDNDVYVDFVLKEVKEARFHLSHELFPSVLIGLRMIWIAILSALVGRQVSEVGDWDRDSFKSELEVVIRLLVRST
jgi:hypothetical protein